MLLTKRFVSDAYFEDKVRHASEEQEGKREVAGRLELEEC